MNIVIEIIVSVASICSVAFDVQNEPLSVCPSISQWMHCLDESIKNRPLTWLAIPGSHNTFAFQFFENEAYAAVTKVKNLTKTKEYANIFSPDLSPDTVSMLSFASFFQGKSYTRDVIGNWSLCQHWNLQEQLDNGIRYLDLRVAWNMYSDQPNFVHGLWGPDVFDSLTSFANDYLPKHEHEIYLLDFNHFYGMNYPKHVKLAKFLLSTFGNRIATQTQWKTPNNMTVLSLQKAKQQIVIFYHELGYIQFIARGAFWSGATIPSPWPNTENEEEMLHSLENVARSHETDRLNFGREYFIVYQAILTPSALTIVSNFGDPKRSLRTVLAENATKTFIEHWLPHVVMHHETNQSLPLRLTTTTSRNMVQTTSHLHRDEPPLNSTLDSHFYLGTFNIFIADFIEAASFPQKIVQLNEIFNV